MSRIIVHVGAGKTGSSALQRHLSFRSDPLAAGDTTYEYCVLEADGTVSRLDRVQANARQSIVGYQSSAHDVSLVNPSRFAAGLRDMETARRIPVFSQENWLAQPFRSMNVECFAVADEIEVVAYLRPQVDWFNSGWWQWWAWDSRITRPEDVLDVWPGVTMHWGHFLEAWARMPNVTKVHARLARNDVVGDFLDLLGVTSGHSAERVNPSMGERMVRLYRALPGLRTPQGAELDIVLARYMQDAGPTPWIVEPQLVERIIGEALETNRRLLSFLEPSQQAEMQSDPRWWNASAYAGRTATPLGSLTMDSREAAGFLAKVIMHAGRPRAV